MKTMAKGNSFNASNILIIFTIIFQLMFSVFAVINPFFAENISGTKWCGVPNTAKNYTDLGKYRETDICCRDHDHCDDFILPTKTKHGLHNKYPYPRLNCKCEKKFFDCLHKANTDAAKLVGYAYFKYSGECYKEDYPIIACDQLEFGFLNIRCGKYIYDKKKPKIFQWIDLPFYRLTKFEW